MLDENIVYSTFHGDPVDADATMMKVNGNDDVGIVVYDKWDRQVSVNGGRMDMDRGENNNGAENNSLTFSAAPASATGRSQNTERLKRTQRSRWKLNINHPTAVYDSRCHFLFCTGLIPFYMTTL